MPKQNQQKTKRNLSLYGINNKTNSFILEFF